MKREKEEMYESPCTRRTLVTLEEGVMKASIFHEENQHDEGLTTEEHGFADPTKDWEGNYGESTWD